MKAAPSSRGFSRDCCGKDGSTVRTAVRQGLCPARVFKACPVCPGVFQHADSSSIRPCNGAQDARQNRLENRPVKGVAKVLGTEAGHTLPPQLVQMPPALPAQLAISKVIRRPVKSQPRVALGPGSRNHRMGTDRGTSSSAAEALALQLGLGGRGQRARGGVLAQVTSQQMVNSGVPALWEEEEYVADGCRCLWKVRDRSGGQGGFWATVEPGCRDGLDRCRYLRCQWCRGNRSFTGTQGEAAQAPRRVSCVIAALIQPAVSAILGAMATVFPATTLVERLQ
ncbi:hypothetical protein CB1_001033010 [Camelus ferus]|nr:hypothetical protein CB1_001033010 [Camelus ferus]